MAKTNDSEKNEKIVSLKEKPLFFPFLVALALLCGVFIGIAAMPLISPPTGFIGLESMLSETDSGEEMQLEELQEKTKHFLENSEMLFFQESLKAEGFHLELTDALEVNDHLYEMVFEVFEGNESYGPLNVFVSSDGLHLLFGELMELGEPMTYTPPPSPTPVEELKCENMPKVDKPELLVFIYTSCGVGLQMQEILSFLPSDLLEYVEVKYISDAEEDLKQVCLREEQYENYWDYVSCYSLKRNSSECLSETGIDLEKLSSCMDSSAEEYVSQDLILAGQFNVMGSPTLVLNESEVDEYLSAISLGENMRSPAHIQKLLCCSFETEPLGCGEEILGEFAEGNPAGAC